MSSSAASVAILAPAKVNLTLEITGRRPDGYHDICSVMQAISLADSLSATMAPDLVLHCSRPELAGPDNLTWRAAELLRRESGVHAGAAMVLEKRIPVAAGLGGGSSDAAASLLALNALWRLGLPRERLAALAAQLGSDVPFFLEVSGCALAEGRGERLTVLPPLPKRWLVLVKPPTGISAGAAYQSFARQPVWGDGSRSREWLRRAQQTGVLPPPFNDLEAAALRLVPDATAARDALLAAGAPHAVMSGSGSTYFSLFDTKASASAAAARIAGAGLEVHLAHFARCEPA